MRRPGRAAATSAALLACTGLAACAPTPYVDGPVARAELPQPRDGRVPRALTVVTYNVHFGEQPEKIAAALVAGGLGDADIYLLQEIEDHSPGELRARALALAAELGTGAVYAPARALPRSGTGSHGLAILSRWPIVEDAVMRLPDCKLLYRARPRIALGALVDVAGTPVQVWNVHLDTRIAPEDRLTQLRPVFERARALPGLAIIGGDLNTPSLAHARPIDALAAREGFATPTAEISDTVAGGWWSWPPEPPMRLDAIFTRGFPVIAAGVDRAVRGSDHVPLWVQVAWPVSPTGYP